MMNVRTCIQQDDEMFQKGHPYRFQTGGRKKVGCSKLFVNGNLVSDADALISTWANHFKLSPERHSMHIYSYTQIERSFRNHNHLEAET